MHTHTIITDGQVTWVAKTNDLVRELGKLGWQHADNVYRILVEPQGKTEDADAYGNAPSPYTDLCQAVAAVAQSDQDGHKYIRATYPETESMIYAPSYGGWSISRGLSDALTQEAL